MKAQKPASERVSIQSGMAEPASASAPAIQSAEAIRSVPFAAETVSSAPVVANAIHSASVIADAIPSASVISAAMPSALVVSQALPFDQVSRNVNMDNIASMEASIAQASQLASIPQEEMMMRGHQASLAVENPAMNAQIM
jgi:hypothetical protein